MWDCFFQSRKTKAACIYRNSSATERMRHKANFSAKNWFSGIGCRTKAMEDIFLFCLLIAKRRRKDFYLSYMHYAKLKTNGFILDYLLDYLCVLLAMKCFYKKV